MTQKSRIVGFFFIALMVLTVFSTCKKDDRVTLKVLYYLEQTAPNAVADADLWFSTFEEDNPDVKIKRENLFDESFHDKTMAYAAAGELPDVLYVWPSGRSDYLHDQELLKDLTPFIIRDNIIGKYLPLTMDPSQQQAGYLAMIPQGITTTHVFYINTEVLDDCGLQPAKTYAELRAQVPLLRAKGYETVLIPAQSDWVMQRCLFSMIAGRFGGAEWHTRILNGQAEFTDPEFVNALDFIRRLYADGVIQRTAVGVEYDEGPEMFANNKGAYYIDGDWRVEAFLTDTSTQQALISLARQENILIGVFPDIPGAKINASSSVILGAGYAMSAAIPAGSDKEEAAWQLVKWMTEREVSELRTEHGGTLTPSRIDLNFDAMDLEPMQKAIGILGDEFSTATVVIDSVFPSEVYNPINTGLIEIAIGQRTPRQVAEDVQRAFETWKAR